MILGIQEGSARAEKPGHSFHWRVRLYVCKIHAYAMQNKISVIYLFEHIKSATSLFPSKKALL